VAQCQFTCLSAVCLLYGLYTFKWQSASSPVSAVCILYGLYTVKWHSAISPVCQRSVYCLDCIQLSGIVPVHLCQLSVYCMDCIQLSGTVPFHLSVSCLYTVWTVYSYVAECQFTCLSAVCILYGLYSVKWQSASSPVCQLSVYCMDCIQLSGTVPVQLYQLSVYCMDCIHLSGRVPVHLTLSCLHTVWTVYSQVAECQFT